MLKKEPSYILRLFTSLKKWDIVCCRRIEMASGFTFSAQLSFVWWLTKSFQRFSNTQAEQVFLYASLDDNKDDILASDYFRRSDGQHLASTLRICAILLFNESLTSHYMSVVVVLFLRRFDSRGPSGTSELVIVGNYVPNPHYLTPHQLWHCWWWMPATAFFYIFNPTRWHERRRRTYTAKFDDALNLEDHEATNDSAQQFDTASKPRSDDKEIDTYLRIP